MVAALPPSGMEGSTLRSSASLLLSGGQTLDIPVKDTLKAFHTHVLALDQAANVASRSQLPRPEISPVFRMKESRMLEDNFDDRRAVRKTAADEELLALVVGASRAIARPHTPRTLFASIEAKDLSGRSRVKHRALYKELLQPHHSRSAGDLSHGLRRKAYYSFTNGIEWRMPQRAAFKQVGPLRPWEDICYEYSEFPKKEEEDKKEQQEEEEEEEEVEASPQ